MGTDTPDQLSDEELVQKITDSDQELYVHIVERYQGPLVRYARTLVYEQEAAEDVVQNAFIKAYQNLRSFKVDKKFSSWVYRITHNEAMNYLKKHKRELRPDDESWFDTIADDRQTTPDAIDQEFQDSLTAKALATLEPKYREPIALYFFEAKSYQEIGEILRIPSATVGTRINRAKQQLKKALDQKGAQR